MKAYSQVLAKMEEEQAMAINSQENYSEAVNHLKAALQLCPNLGKFLRSAIAEAERFQEYAENDEYCAYYRAQEELDAIDEQEEAVISMLEKKTKSNKVWYRPRG